MRLVSTLVVTSFDEFTRKVPTWTGLKEVSEEVDIQDIVRGDVFYLGDLGYRALTDFFQYEPSDDSEIGMIIVEKVQ